MCLAVPGELVARHERDGVIYGEVRFGSIVREVCLHALPDAMEGDFVLVHVGFAIARIDREEAARTLEILAALGEGEAQIEPSKRTFAPSEESQA